MAGHGTVTTLGKIYEPLVNPNKLGYEHSTAYNSGYLSVGDTHEIYFEEYGKPDGKAALFVHGGPGGETNPGNARFFDPTVYNVVLFDQRGAGKSRPSAEIRANTSHHLVADIEKLRESLGISRWHVVFGGSWGSTLALLYAQTHPDKVSSPVLRGIFLPSAAGHDWFRWSNVGAAGYLFPEANDAFLEFLPVDERKEPLNSYYKRLTSDDASVSLPAAKAWNTWEMSIGNLYLDPKLVDKVKDDRWNLNHARLEAHYFVNGAWLKEGQLLEQKNIDRIRHIPTTIIQGRYDIVCPPVAAWLLYKTFPEARLQWVPDAGHSASEPGTFLALVKACDDYGKL